MQPYQQSFPAFIDNEGKIYAQQGYQGNQHIGWTNIKYEEINKICSEALDKADMYKKQLIDAGLLTTPLSTDEQITILNKKVSDLTDLVSKLISKETVDDKPITDN